MSPGPGIYARNRTSGVVLTPPRPRITIGARVVTRQGGACGWRGPNQPHRCIRWRPPLGEGFYENIAAGFAPPLDGGDGLGPVGARVLDHPGLGGPASRRRAPPRP